MAHMSGFEPGRHLGIWKKRGNLGNERKNGAKSRHSDQSSILMSGNTPYEEGGGAFLPNHLWSPAAGDHV